MKKLLIILSDRISEIIAKGEIIDRYYNPGDVFDEVHFLMIGDDRPDGRHLQKLVGRAHFHVHNYPAGRRVFLRTLGWRPVLLRRWAKGAVGLAARIRPSLVRCHGAHLNAYVASEIKRVLGVPYLVSLHINPDEDVRGRDAGFIERLRNTAIRTVEKTALRNADLVMPVYRPIVPYLERLGVRRYEVCYNVLNPAHLKEKADYALHSPVRIISVGRQFHEKNPDNLIRAVASLPNVQLTLVGDGSYHDYLRRVADETGCGERFVFHRALSNDALCSMLPEFDIFAVHSEYWEIAKSVLEPLLCGMPVIINRRAGEPVPELTQDICMLIDNSVEGYRDAILALVRDDGLRERLGRAAYAHAAAYWVPEKTEAKFAGIYRKHMLPEERA